MSETNEPTREQIERIATMPAAATLAMGRERIDLRILAAMALRTLDAEEDLDRARKLHASFPGSPLASEVIDGQARRLEEMASQLAAMTERAESAGWERDEARADLESMTVLYNTAWPALESARAERDEARAKLAERERYIAEQRAITEPAVQDLARQLREATERAEKAERLSATLRAVAEQEVADAIVKSRERATRVGWIDHATGDYEERAVTMLMDDLAAGSAVCAFLRMVGVWTLEDRAEKAERERHVAVSVMREMRVAWDGASDQRNDLRAKLAEVERERDVSRSALNSIVSELRDALGDFPMVGEKWTDAVKRLRARLAEVERERDEERHLATVRGEMLSVYERRIAELSSRGNVIANRVFWIDHVTGDRCEHVTKSTFEDLMHIEAIATAFRMIAFDVIRAKLADAERCLAEVERERDEAASEAAAHNAAATQYEKDIADLRAKLLSAEAIADAEGTRAKFAESELDEALVKLAERDRYIAEQRAITEPSVQDLARQLREATERAERAEAKLAEVELDEVRAKRSDMHRRAQLAENPTTHTRCEAIFQRQRADWWRSEAKRLGWTPDYPELRAVRCAAPKRAAEVTNAESLCDRLARMHRRAQRAESATADARREAIGQRKRADWWRCEAKRLGWTPDYPELREEQTSDARIDCESSSLLLLSTWARKVMMRPKNRAKGVPTQSILELLRMAWHELSEARWAISDDAPTDDILAELGDAAAIIGFAMREIEKRRKA